VDLLHLTARTTVEWMFYCLMEGTLLALLAWILLRLLPRQNSGTRFVLWFSVLMGVTLLPFLAGAFFRNTATEVWPTAAMPRHSLVTLPDSLAIGIFGIWAVVAGVGLLRVGVGLWQVNRIRKDSQEVDPNTLDAVIRTTLESFPRSVSLRTSGQLQVPAAIGFFQPAVVVPRWFLQEIPTPELQQILLHELTHLRRRDDWTNLTQKIIKALLFFHPSVWWLENRLSLEREMACDEAVLAQSGSPHGYAQCLTRLAEKTLIKKKIALAQGLVSRMRQLSLRVAQVLDADRPSGTRVWKPMVPMVLAVATVCGVSAWNAPALVAFHNDAVVPGMARSDSAPLMPKAINADFNSTTPQPKMVLAGASLNQKPVRPHMTPTAKKPQRRPEPQPQASPKGDYVISEQIILTVAGEPGSQRWQVRMWQVSLWQVSIPAASGNHAGKTLSRKNI
jgi:beta-lactamase regulating signal transducer with metallopeptidase domain